MDINQAKLLLANLIKSRTDELASLQLASNLLNDTFKDDFTARDTAAAEADRLASEKASIVADKEAAVAQLTQVQAESAAKDEVIISLQPVDAKAAPENAAIAQ